MYFRRHRRLLGHERRKLGPRKRGGDKRSNRGGKESHLLEGHAVGGDDVVVGHLVDDLPVLAAAAVLHRDGLDEAVVLVHGEHVEGGVAPHVLVDDERAGLLEGARVGVRVEGLLVDLEKEG